MPAPTTIQEFLDFVKKSELVELAKLDGYVAHVQKAGTPPANPAELASLMVRDGLLTLFQAEQIMLGKCKGFRIGSYVVLRPLGVGGMARVYLAQHQIRTERKVAIKVLPKTRAEDSSILKRFRREGRVIAALDHPNIVHAYEFDQDDKLHFMVMEYVEGETLHDVVQKRGALAIGQAANFMLQAAHGLAYINSMGLIHRDIKPANLLLDKQGTVKIFDMGLARYFQDETMTRGVLGTADYIAPEQTYDSHKVDIRADIYGLGGCFYYILTARIPFGEGTVAQKIESHRQREPEPIRSIRHDVPLEIIDIVATMMAKDPDQRFQSPEEVIHAVEPFADS